MKNMSKLYKWLLLGLGVSHAAFAAAAYAAAELKMDRSVISDAYWEIWNDAEQARIDEDIEANRKADGTFDIAAPDGGGVKGEPLVSGLFTRVKWNGTDLGVRAWAPFDWKLPSSDPGLLEVKIYTPVVNIMGDHLRKGSDWNTRFWLSPRDTRYGAGLFPVVNESNNKGETTL